MMRRGRGPVAMNLHGYPDLRTLAEEGDLAAAYATYWELRNGGIGDVLLLRMAERLGILPAGVNAAEQISSWKL